MTQQSPIPKFDIRNAPCEEELRRMAPDSIDCIVTAPPYGLSEAPDPAAVMAEWILGNQFTHSKRGFMNKKWDSFVPSPSAWKAALRVLKPGGYALVFAGSRTQDWMSMSLRFAGFEVVDTIMWVYAQGMPKSLNISKAFNKSGMFAEAQQWDGWGTQLKPAYEPIIVCRKPLNKSFAKNIAEHGVGGLNIDGCRVEIDAAADAGQLRTMMRGARTSDINEQTWGYSKNGGDQPQVVRQEGRWPANFAHDGSESVLGLFPQSDGAKAAVTGTEPSASKGGVNTFNLMQRHTSAPWFDAGSAARFFFCAKAPSKERHLGLENPGRQFRHGSTLRDAENLDKRGNHHPTVKPIKLMRWLVRLVCPPGGTVLDVYCGSGSTGFAAIEEGFNFIGIERVKKYASISKARCSYALQMLTGEESARKRHRKKQRAAGKFFKGDQISLF